jgi:hypothetical protein
MALFSSTLSHARRVALAAGLMVLSVPNDARPAGAPNDQPMAEVQVKGAFLVNFARFVAWPAAERPVAICVADNAPLAAAATEIGRARLIDGRAVVARGVSASGSTDGCDLLYLGDLKADDAAAMLSRVRGPVLTVGETPRFLRDGGMVRIFLEGNRMRFQVNRRQTDAAGLKISSQLLALASQ